MKTKTSSAFLEFLPHRRLLRNRNDHFVFAPSESNHPKDVVRIAEIVHEIRQGRSSFTARVLGGDPIEGWAFHPIGRQRGAFILASCSSMN
jgi:hypothetical protein